MLDKLNLSISRLYDLARRNACLLHYGILLLIALQLAVVGYCKIALYQKSFVTSDGALFANMLWNTNFTDRFLYTHYREISWGIQTYLADHFSPTLLLLAPIYHLLPSPLMLVITQTIMPGIACGLIYWCGLKVLKNPFLSFCVAVTYLFVPSMILGTIDDVYGFHHDSLIAPLAVLLILFLVEKRPLLYLATLTLFLGLKENLPLTGILLGSEVVVYGLLKHNKYYARLGAATLVLAAAFAFTGLWLVPRLAGSPPRYTLQVIASLTKGDFGDPTVPLYWLSVIVVFLPALLAPEVLLLTIPDLIALVVMKYPPYDWHVFAPVTFIAIAWIVGVSRLLRLVGDRAPSPNEKEPLALISVSFQEKAAAVLCRFRPSWVFLAVIVLLLAGATYLQYPTPRNVFSYGQEVNEVMRSLLHNLSNVGVVIIVLVIGNRLLRRINGPRLLVAVSLLPMIVAIAAGGEAARQETAIIQHFHERVNLSDMESVARSIPSDSYLAVTSDLLVYFTNRTYLLWPSDPQAEYMLVNDNAVYDYDSNYVKEMRAKLEARQVEVVTSSGKITLYRRTAQAPAAQP